MLADRRKNDTMTNCKEAKKRACDRKLEGHNYEFHGSVFFCHPTLHLPCSLQVQLTNTIALKGREVSKPEAASADVLAVADPSQPGPALKWIAMLTGTLLADPTFIVTGGMSGCAFRMVRKAIVSQPRRIWISPR